MKYLLVLIFLLSSFSCSQKGNNIASKIVTSLNSNHYIASLRYLDSLKIVNPHYMHKDTTIDMLKMIIGKKFIAYYQNIANQGSEADFDSVVSLVKLTDSVQKYQKFDFTDSVNKLHITDFSMLLRNLYSYYSLNSMRNILAIFAKAAFSDTNILFTAITSDTFNLHKLRRKVGLGIDSNKNESADSVIYAYMSLISTKRESSKIAMTKHDIAIVKLKNLFIGTWSKYEASPYEVYATQGVKTKEYHSYILSHDGNVSLKEKTIFVSTREHVNEGTEKSGSWLFNEKDTSVSLKFTKERDLNFDYTYAATYGDITNNNGTSEWKDCSSLCDEDYTLASFKENGYRKAQ